MTEQEKKDPAITVFGEDISEKDKEYSREGGILWGAFLIFAGILLFLNTLELLPWEVWNEIWKFWPILLILAGLKIVLGKNIISNFFTMLMSFIFFGSLLLYILFKHTPQFVDWVPEILQNYANLWEVVAK